MKFSFKHSIGIRFLRIVFGCYLFVTVTITSLQLYSEYSSAEKEVITELANVGRSFEDGLATALWNLDNDAIESILAGIRKIEIIDGVKVVGLQDDLQGANGVYIDNNTSFTQFGVVSSGEIQVKELSVQGLHSGNYYEYTLGVIFEEPAHTKPEFIGFMSLYANHDRVVQRFKRSFFLILIIAIIKTFSLWLIFLYFARRVVAKPLTELAIATQNLGESDKHHHQPKNLTQLENIAASTNRDEIQALASGFLSMQRSILEKLDNLYGLNDFAIQLSKASTSQCVFEHTNQLLNLMFGCKFSIIFENSEMVLWSSIPDIELKGLKIYENDQKGHFNSQYYERSIAYIHDGATYPVLIIPLIAKGFEGKQMRFFGSLHRDRLTQELRLSRESKSFLQVVSAMVGNTLTGIHQREVIQQQNQSLELRVAERTRELADVNAELKYLAVHDPLTELPNRTLFNDRLEQMIHHAKRDNRQFAMASIDLTKFKKINDNYGHDAGDAVLVEVSKRFVQVLRSTDTLARMGGDEFAALLSDTTQEASINKIMSSLIDCLEAPILLSDGAHVHVGANIGVALYPEHAQFGDHLFKYADIAMYNAKREGKYFGIFDVEKNTEEKEFILLISELENAIQKGELVLNFQPIVDLNTQAVVGAEALVLWDHPRKGLIPPKMFINHAERSPHITPLTHWVIENACTQCQTLREANIPIYVSVNISSRVFSSPELPQQLQALLDKYGLDASDIRIEITESTAMDDPDHTLEILSRFDAMGTPIIIDDFGTGHSSLAYLTRLPIKEIKIDQCFLISDTANNRAAVETIIELAHALALKVIAEGIENEAALSLLNGKICDFGQGSYLSAPLGDTELEAYLTADIEH